MDNQHCKCLKKNFLVMQVNGELFSADTTIFKRSNQTGLVLWMGDKHTEFTWSSPHWKEGGPNTGGLSGRILAPMHGRVVKVGQDDTPLSSPPYFLRLDDYQNWALPCSMSHPLLCCFRWQ